MAKKYKILYLGSDLLDFDGTRGDMLYFLSRLKAYGIAYEYVEHHITDSIEVEAFDFIYAGVCPQKYEMLYLQHLQTNIHGLAAYIESGKPMLAIEQSFLFLARQLTFENEETQPLLGILPLEIYQRQMYAIGNILLATAFDDFHSKINGFINTRYTFTTAADAEEEHSSLGTILLGVDFLWERGYEGVRYKNFFGTQLRGPILPRNYDLTDYLICLMLQEATLPSIDSTLDLRAKEQLTVDAEAFIASGEQKKEYVYVS